MSIRRESMSLLFLPLDLQCDWKTEQKAVAAIAVSDTDCCSELKVSPLLFAITSCRCPSSTFCILSWISFLRKRMKECTPAGVVISAWSMMPWCKTEGWVVRNLCPNCMRLFKVFSRGVICLQGVPDIVYLFCFSETQSNERNLKTGKEKWKCCSRQRIKAIK